MQRQRNVNEDKRISIKFRFRDELAKCQEMLGQNEPESGEKSDFCCFRNVVQSYYRRGDDVMAKEVTLQVRMDADIKEQVEQLYKKMGNFFCGRGSDVCDAKHRR